MQQTHQQEKARQKRAATGGQGNGDEQAVEAGRDEQRTEDASGWT